MRRPDEKTKHYLARVLREAGLTFLALRAEQGCYDDFESQSAQPIHELVRDLSKEGQHHLAQRAMNGEFDATLEESEAWYVREGKGMLSHDPKRAQMRLAFRTEGEFVNCYMAKVGTLTDSVLLGSMRRNVLAHDELWSLWKMYMQTVLAHMIQAVTGGRAEFDGTEHPAPDGEKSGNA